jgi:murein DD-endopeptidase MepM/ murein hydrolase activator NlpD
MHLGLTLEFDAAKDEGDAVHGKLGIDITVDEDFLSLRDPRVVLRGEFAQGGLIHGKVVPGTKVWFRGKRVKVAETGDFVFGFGRDAKRRATVGFAFGGAPAERHVVHVGQREYEPERIDGLPEEMVDLDAATRKELARSRKQVAKVRDKTSSKTFFVEGWTMPVKGKITSTYGRPRILNGEDHGFHWGVDIATPVGKKVKAPAPGVVVLAEMNVPLSGNLVIIDHGHGLTSSFLHLHKILVAVGDEVRKGQTIAEAGKTGRVKGAHLDWRMNLHDTRIDPMLVMKL